LLTYAAKHWPGWRSQVLIGLVRAEAWVRTRWKRWKGDAEKAEQYAVLEEIAAKMWQRDSAAARRCLLRFIRTRERNQTSDCRLQAAN
jgi:hypothetical protein